MDAGDAGDTAGDLERGSAAVLGAGGVEGLDHLEHSLAIVTRSVVTGSSTRTQANSSLAFLTVSNRPVPPSTNRHSSAWSRQIVPVRTAVIW